ncbi:MAG: radical SAM protein [bacterium]|nr:radical SAM protein [bacterium]
MKKLLIWDITSACNLKCIHCYNAEKYDGKRKDIGKTLTLQEALDTAEKLHYGGFRRVLLIGGEPLMYPDLPVLIKFLKDRGFTVMVTTNGTLLVSQTLVELKIDSMLASIDGATEKTNDEIRGKGTFLLATENLKRFAQIVLEKSVNTLTGIGFVVTKKKVRQNESIRYCFCL